MQETILVCENSVEGVLTAVYRAYQWKLEPASTRIQIGEDDLRLFAAYKQVETDPQLAVKVARTICRRFGQEAYEDICYALAAGDADRGQAVYQTIAVGLSGQIRGRLMGALAAEPVRRVFELSRAVHREAHRMLMFVRFRELEGQVLFARIEPEADVVGLIMPHFADRFPQEDFMIADTRRKLVGVHKGGEDWFLMRPTGDMARQMLGAAEQMDRHVTIQEQEIARLFCCFCSSVAIRQRTNRVLQQQLMPLRYRPFMTEFQEEQKRP